MNYLMATFRGITQTEIRGQFRSGLSALYLGMPFFWIIIARLVPLEIRPLIVLIGAYTDPVTMGQLFTGAFVARERDQGLFEAWAVSPLDAGTWLLSRSILIGLQGSIGGLILALGSGVSFRIELLIPGLFLAAVSGALLGLIIARPFRDILSYFVVGGFATAIISLPIPGILLAPSYFWLISGPAASGWVVLANAFYLPNGVSALSPFISLAALLLWTVLLFVIARGIYHRGFFRRPGFEVTG